MMKHLQISQSRPISRADNVSLSSIVSSSCSSSSHLSLNDTSSIKTTIKVHTSNMRSDVEYKTISVTFQTTSKEIIELLMKKLKLKNRDPRLYFITMDIVIRRSGAATSIALEEWECPAMLQSSYPKGEQAKFTIRAKQGCLVKIYDSDINENSQYKTLVISDESSTSELIELYLNTCGNKDHFDNYSLYEIDSKSLKTNANRISPIAKPVLLHENDCVYSFKIKKNPKYVKNMFAQTWIQRLPVIPHMTDECHMMDFRNSFTLDRNYHAKSHFPRSSYVFKSPRYSEYCI